MNNNFLKSLYADLRDRRLLPVVALLLVALVAVPFVMGKDPEAGPPPPADAAAVDPAFEADAVVLASTPELRAYRKRLSQFQARNPFNQYAPKVDEEAAAEAATAATATGEVPVDPGAIPTDPGTITDPGGTVPPATDPTDPVDPVPAEPDDGGGTTFVTTRIDVRFGPVGETEVYKNLKFLDFLPDAKTPVVEYLQSDFDLTNAVFIVSPFVLSSEGDGKCGPSPQNCQFLQLEVGKTHAFQYDDGKRYTLTLLDVNIHEEPAEEAIPEDAGRTPDFATPEPAGKVVDG